MSHPSPIPQPFVLKRSKRSQMSPSLQPERAISRLPSPFSRMPNEILYAIGKFIQVLRPARARTTWKHDLSSLSRTSKAFTVICQQLIFESITIWLSDFTVDRDKGMLFFDHEYPKVLFADIFPNSTTQLASYVRTLTYRDYMSHPFGPSADQRSIKALEGLVNVSELRIEATKPSKAWPHIDVFFNSEGQLGKAVLKIMHSKCLRALKLVGVRIPAAELSKCSALETLELSESLCHSDSEIKGRGSPVEGSLVYVKHLIYKGSYKKNELAFLPQGSVANRLLFRWDELRTATLGFEDSNFKNKSEIPNHIMRNAKRLERLDLYSTRPSDPFGERDQECPISHLHSGSFETLTYLSLRIDYAVNHPPEQWGIKVLRDPYHGLLKDGMLQRLVSLEELCLDIRFGGSSVRAVYEDKGLLGDGWMQLDRVLASKGRERPCKRLRRVSLVYGTIPDCTDEAYDEVAFNQAFVDVITKFEGTKEVAREGDNNV